MPDVSKELKTELEKSVAVLQTLRDEVRVRLHLAGMEAKTQWNDLEPKVEDAVGRAKREVTEATKTVVTETTSAVKKFREALR